MAPKTIILSAVSVVALIIIAIAGYFISIKVEEVHKENVESLAEFGSKVVPMSHVPDGATFGLTDGQMQLPPSLQEKKLSPTEKVILSLSRDKDLLLVEVAELKDKLDAQTNVLGELRDYKAENERFAPERLTEERIRAQGLLKEYFDNSSDVSEFSTFQQQAMNLASANLFTEIVRQYGLILYDDVKDKMIQLLPGYGLCLGEGLPFVTNSRGEEIQLLKALADGDMSSLGGSLAEDYDSIHTPCLKQLNREVSQLLINSNLSPTAALTADPAGGDDAANDSGPSLTPGMSPTEQLIESLTYDKKQLLAKVKKMKNQLASQTLELEELRQYRRDTERYAPLPPEEERKRALEMLTQLFDDSRDANRFSSFQKEAMSLAAANQYAKFTRQHKLVLSDNTKDEIIQNLLPRYGFCYGDSLKFVIDNRLSERQLINALREQDLEYMDKPLQRSVTSIIEPCIAQLDQLLKAYL